MLKLDMGGTVVPGSAYAEKGPDRCIIFADVDSCNVYPDEVITWSLASSPHFEIAQLIADAINAETAKQETAYSFRKETVEKVEAKRKHRTSAIRSNKRALRTTD